MTLFAEIKIKTVLAFVPYPNNGHHLAAMTLNIFADLLSWLDNQLYSMCLMVMSSNLDMIKVSSKITILTHTEMSTVSTNKACTNDRPHITPYTLMIIVSSKSICQ